MSTDAEIIRRSWRDPDGFAEIFDRHGPHIHRYLARRLGRDTADDLLAETFLAAFDKRKRYDTERLDARPWLYGFATILVSKHRRDEVREFRIRQAVPPADHEVGHADKVAGDVTAQALGGLLADALAVLAAPDRDVLTLIAWEQLSYEEVAAALGIPVGTVRSRLNRARRKVREALGAGASPTTFEELLSNG